jgi:hypothetical protein
LSNYFASLLALHETVTPCEKLTLYIADFLAMPIDLDGTSADIARRARCGELSNPPCKVVLEFGEAIF